MKEQTGNAVRAGEEHGRRTKILAAGKTPFLRAEKKTILWLCLLLLATCLIGLFRYLFEGRFMVYIDIGSDTWQQYIGLYSAIARKIGNGDFTLWSTNIGLGTGIFMLNPTNPALLVVYLLGAAFGVGAIPGLMVFVYIAEIFLAGILAYFYLSSFSFGEVPKLLAAYMYALSGFMIVWGQHYQFAIVPSFLILELLMAERCLKTRRWGGLVLATAVSVFSSMYISYMILLFTGIYVLLRILLRERKARNFFTEAFRVLWPIALGVGIGMVTLLPTAYSIFGVSSRMKEASSLAERMFYMYPKTYFKALFARLLSCVGQGINEATVYMNYYEGPCLFFSSLFLPLFWQYVCLLPGRRVARGRRRLAAVLLLVGLVAVLTPTAGAIFNGFTKTFNRYMFLLMPGFALIAAVALEEILRKKRFSVPGAVLGLLSLLGGYGWIVFRIIPADKFIRVMLIAHAAAGAAMLFLLFAASRGEKPLRFLSARRIAVLLTILLAANVTAEMSANHRTRIALRRNGNQMSLIEDADTLEALAKVKAEDEGWYRIEKLYGATDSMDAPFQGYRAVSNYCSTLNSNVLTFAEKEWPGLFLWDHNHLTYRTASFDAGLSRLLGVKYLLSKDGYIDTFNTYPLEKGTGVVPAEFEKIAECGSVTIYRDPEVDGIFSFYPAEAGQKSLAVQYDERSREAEISFSDTKREDVVTARVSLPSDGLLFAAIPYETGWTALVDGQKTEIEKVHNGFSGLRLSAGEHEVRFEYTCPGFKTGALVSLCSLLVFVFLLIIFRLREKRRS